MILSILSFVVYLGWRGGGLWDAVGRKESITVYSLIIQILRFTKAAAHCTIFTGPTV